MSYLGLETVKPIKPMKRGDLYSFPVTTIDQIVTDEETNERLPEYLDKNFGMDLLWTNASPTSSFGAQTISLNIAPYNWLLICCKVSVAHNGRLVFLVKKDVENFLNFSINGGTGAEIIQRNMKVTDESVEFGDALINGNVGNNALLLLEIYGIK